MLRKLLIKLVNYLETLAFPERFVKLEYHIPLEPLLGKYQDVIHADVKFNAFERKQLALAVQDWNLFCNNLIEIDLIFDYYGREDFEEDRTVLHRTEEKTNKIKQYEEENKVSVLGFFTHSPTGRADLYLIPSKLYTEHEWRTTAMHEIGHLLGLQHIPEVAVMHSSSNFCPIYMNQSDAKEFARIYKLDPEDLVYALNT